MKALLLYVVLSCYAAGNLVYEAFTRKDMTFALAFTRLVSPKLNKTILFNGLFSVLVMIMSFSITFFFGELREIERYVLSLYFE
jgi:hypothetical protein